MSIGERYYREELRFLRDLGREFARAHPQMARFLDGEGLDPDVERLLEGTAFLTARLRQRLDEDCPELLADVLDALWPQHLLPTPAMAVVQALPPPRALEPIQLPRGSQVESRPIDGTRCRFATAWDHRVVPLEVAASEWLDADRFRLRFTAPPGADARALVAERLRLHLAGGGDDARWLRRRLVAETTGIVVRSERGEARLPPASIQQAGFAADEALLPSVAPTSARLRLLHEYAAFPEKFLFLDLMRLDRVDVLAGQTAFEIVIELARLPGEVPREPRLALNCVPVVNAFACEGEPLRCDGRGDLVLRAVGDARHHEVFALTSLVGAVPGSIARRRYVATDRRRPGEDRAPGYRLRRWGRPDGDGTEVAVDLDDDPHPGEVLSADLLCTNRRLTARLGVGDLAVAGAGTPPALRLRNLGRPTTPLPPPARQSLRSRLQRHLALDDPCGDANRLRDLLELTAVDREPVAIPASTIAALRTAAATRLHEGTPVRGREVEVRIAGDPHVSPAERHLFGCVLDRALASASPLNQFLQLRLIGDDGAMLFPARLGGGAMS